MDADAFLPFQGREVDSSASSALTAQDADDFVQSPFATEFMPVEFKDVEFRHVAQTERSLGSVLTTLSRQSGWLAHLQPALRQTCLS
jgi:cell division inhibitor SulA